MRLTLGPARRAFLRGFLDEAGRAAARPWLRAVADRRAVDPHMSGPERARMRRLADAAGAPREPPGPSATRSVG